MNSLVDPKQSVELQAGASTAGHWHASLALQFARTAAGTRLLRSRHQGPLYVQRPFYPEGEELAHVYLLHPPGGLVSGDQLRINLQVGTAASVLCTTPGAGRLYRARADQRLQEQLNYLQVEDEGTLEWFPLETIVYRGAVARLETRVELAPSARFAGWEITSLGLPASGVRFDAGEFTQRFVLTRAGRPALVEKLHIAGADSHFAASAAALQGQAVSGIFVCGPFAPGSLSEALLHDLRAQLQAVAPARCGFTVLGDFVVLRYLGMCTEAARNIFISCWRSLRPLLLQRALCLPRIWAT